MRVRLLIVLSLVASAFMVIPGAATAAPPAPTCGPYMTLTPPFGVPGSQVSVNLFHFPPNDEIEVILRVPGNPVVGTGTTDDQGHANIMITMLDFDGDQVAVFAQASPCFAAGAYFEYREVTPTPSPTPIQVTATPTAVPTTPGTTPTTTTPVVTVTAPPTTPTPQAPIAGTGTGGFGSTGMNLALVGLALVIFCGAFALWGSTRKPAPVRINRDRDDF